MQPGPLRPGAQGKLFMQTLVSLLAVTAAPPTLQDNTADLDRLRRALARKLDGQWPALPLARTMAVAASFRRAGFKGVALVNDLPGGPELVDFLPAMPQLLPMVALDLGTTHLEASLKDGISGRTLALAIRENGQLDYGADILTRIHFAARDNGLALLHRRVIDSINDLIRELAEAAGIDPEQIRAMSVSGNTTMVHFFLRLNPHHLCREPYIPVINRPDPFVAAALDLKLHPAAVVWVLPSVGSYFGGDLISGILASDIDLGREVSMLIDVGTNAEVVIGNRDWLMACAGAAGPALEGGVARMGMRAGPGAVEHVSIDPEEGRISCRTIGQAPAQGICGSGMIDLVAGLYLARIIDMRGRFRVARAAALTPGRLIELDDGPAFVVVAADEAADGRPVVLTQPDLDALLRSKAAMYAILATLVNQVGLEFKDLQRIWVAGAFGRHIEPRAAIILGMLPDLPLETYQPLGNSSLAGAERFLLEQEVRDRCQRVVKKITYIELNVNQEFMIRFSGSRFIPHTDQALFPSVPFFNT